jgi:tRNA uridine 5-carbamoylmethylation protein Kti12
MATALFSDLNAELTRLRSALSTVQAAKLRIISGGQSFNVSGSMAVTQVDLDKLTAEEERLKQQIIKVCQRIDGVEMDRQTVWPDFREGST